MKETRPNKHPTDGNFRLISASTMMLFYRLFSVKLKLQLTTKYSKLLCNGINYCSTEDIN